MLSTRRLASASLLALLFMITLTVTGYAGGPWPNAVGGGTASDGTKFAFSALAGPSSARGDYGSAGHARIDLAAGTMSGKVSCVAVNGAEVVFVFQYTDAAGNPMQARVYAKDNDGAGSDLIGWDNVGATCSVNPADNTLYPANQGPTAFTYPVVKGKVTIS